MAKSNVDLAALRACVLVGGLGLRLRPLISDRPKALAPVGGRPFLDYVLRQLSTQGIRRVTLCCGYGSEAIRQFAGAGSDWGLAIAYSEERVPLGTAGALRLAMEGFPDEELLVLNGDSFVDIPFGQLVAGHRSAEAGATLAVRWTRDTGRFGSVEVGDGGRVIAFREKVSHGPAWINAGVYVLNRDVLAGLPLDAPRSLEQDVFPGLAQRGGPGGLFTVGFDAWFTDIGVPTDYEALDRDPSALRHALRRGLTC